MFGRSTSRRFDDSTRPITPGPCDYDTGSAIASLDSKGKPVIGTSGRFRSESDVSTTPGSTGKKTLRSVSSFRSVGGMRSIKADLDAEPSVCEDTQTRMKRMARKAYTEAAEAKAALSSVESELEKATLRCQELEEELKTVATSQSATVSGLQTELDAANAAKTAAEASVEALKEEMDAMTERHNTELSAAVDAVKAETEAKVADVQSVLSAAKDAHAKELQSTIDAGAQETSTKLKELSAQHTAAVAQVEAQYAASVRALKSRHDSRVASLGLQAETKLEEQRAAFDNILTLERRGNASQAKDFQAKLKVLKADAASDKATTSATIAALNAKIASLNQEVADAKADLEAARSQYTQQAEDLRVELTEGFGRELTAERVRHAEAAEQWERERQNLKALAESVIAKWKDGTSDLAATTKQLKQARGEAEEAQRKMKDMETVMEAVKAETEQKEEAMRSAIDGMQAKLDASVASASKLEGVVSRIQAAGSIDELLEAKQKLDEARHVEAFATEAVHKLAEETGKLAGHRNAKQRVQYVMNLKKENMDLRQQLAKLQVGAGRASRKENAGPLTARA